MATLPVIRYPLDPTGVNPDNLVQAEPHAMVRRRERIIAPLYGAFFTDSLVLRDAATNAVLTRGVQYFAAELYELPTARYGKEICAIIVVTDESVSDNVTVTYQALGGEFSTSATAVKQQLEALNLDDRPVQWGSIIAKPSEYPPSHHLHDLGDVFGFEYVVHALDRIRAAIEMGDATSHDAIFSYIDQVTAALDNADLLTQQSLALHRDNFNNPHNVNAAQIGTYTQLEINALLAEVSGEARNHATNYLNPHQVTAEQVGAYTKAQTYTQAQVDGAISTAIQNYNTIIAPQITALNTSITNHVAASGNVHNLTAGQLGVYTKAEVNSLVSGSASATRGALEVTRYTGYPGIPFTGSDGQGAWWDITFTKHAYVQFVFTVYDTGSGSPYPRIYRNGVAVFQEAVNSPVVIFPVIVRPNDTVRVWRDNTTTLNGGLNVYDL